MKGQKKQDALKIGLTPAQIEALGEGFTLDFEAGRLGKGDLERFGIFEDSFLGI